MKPIRQVVFYAPQARNEWLGAHKEHNNPNRCWGDRPGGPFLNPEQPSDPNKPRLLCLVCKCGERFVYEAAT